MLYDCLFLPIGPWRLCFKRDFWCCECLHHSERTAGQLHHYSQRFGSQDNR